MPAGGVIRLVEVQHGKNVRIGDRDELIKAIFPTPEKDDVDPPDATARYRASVCADRNRYGTRNLMVRPG